MSTISVGKFRICLLILLFATGLLHGQQDSLEVERLYTSGMENVRVKTKMSIQNFEEAIRIINDSILPRESGGYFLLKKALMQDQLSHYYRMDTEYVSSLKAAGESLKIKEEIGETFTLSETYRLFARLYLHKKDSIKALQFYDKALALAKQYGNGIGTVNALNGLCSYYYTRKEFDEGRAYAQKAFDYADSIGFERGRASALSRLGSYERRKKKYKAVIPYAEKSLEICERINDKIGIERNYKDLGYVYRKTKQPKKAISYYRKSLDLLIDIGLEGSIANRCLAISNAYTDLGDHEQAFAFYRGYKRQQIKDMNVKSIKEFAELEAKYTYERQKAVDSIQFVEAQKIKEARLLQEASTRFWKTVAIIIGVFGLALATAIFVLRRRKEQILLGKLKNQLLQNEINYKQKDISDFALNISRNRQWREELLRHIKKIKKSSELKNDTNFKALEKAVIEREIVDNNRIDVQDKVDVLNTAFYEKLHKAYPTLTKTEAKLCSLIRLNIDNNEIAILQNVAVESVYRSRSRLRKKLNLSPKDDLDAILRKL